MKYAAQLCGFQLKRMRERFPLHCGHWRIYAVFRDEKLGDNIVWGDPQTFVYREWTTNGETWHQQCGNERDLPDDYPYYPNTFLLKKTRKGPFLVGSASHRVNASSRVKDRMVVYLSLGKEDGMKVVKMIRYEAPILDRHTGRLGPEMKVAEITNPPASP